MDFIKLTDSTGQNDREVFVPSATIFQVEAAPNDGGSIIHRALNGVRSIQQVNETPHEVFARMADPEASMAQPATGRSPGQDRKTVRIAQLRARVGG